MLPEKNYELRSHLFKKTMMFLLRCHLRVCVRNNVTGNMFAFVGGLGAEQRIFLSLSRKKLQFWLRPLKVQKSMFQKHLWRFTTIDTNGINCIFGLEIRSSWQTIFRTIKLKELYHLDNKLAAPYGHGNIVVLFFMFIQIQLKDFWSKGDINGIGLLLIAKLPF